MSITSQTRHARGDPLVDDEMAAGTSSSPPARRAACARRSARVAARPPAGRVGGTSRAPRLNATLRDPMPAPPTAAEIRDVNARYHDAAADDYDAKWGIDFGVLGQDQVLTKLRKALGRNPEAFGRALEIGAGTGYFTLNLMQAGIVRSAVCMDISPGMLDTLQRNAAELGLPVATVAGDAEVAAARGRELRPRARPRRAASHPRPGARVRRVPPRAQARWVARLRRRAVALRRPARRGPQAGSRRPGAAVAGRARRALRMPATRSTTGTAITASRRSSTSTPSIPRSCAGWPPEPGWRTFASRARSCSPHGSGGRTEPWRPPPPRKTFPGCGASTRIAGISCSSASIATCSRAACLPRSSTTSCSRRGSLGRSRRASRRPERRRVSPRYSPYDGRNDGLTWRLSDGHLIMARWYPSAPAGTPPAPRRSRASRRSSR